MSKVLKVKAAANDIGAMLINNNTREIVRYGTSGTNILFYKGIVTYMEIDEPCYPQVIWTRVTKQEEKFVKKDLTYFGSIEGIDECKKFIKSYTNMK